MNLNIEEMITLNYELEGLLYLALHRGDDTPPKVWEMISAKIESLREAIPDNFSDNNEEKTVAQHDDEEETINNENRNAAQAIVNDNDNQPTHNAEDTNELQPLPIPEEPTQPATPDEMMTLIKEEELEAAEAEPLEEPRINLQDKYVPFSEQKVSASDSANSNIRLDEKLARENSKNLRKAFSLNDKFRFRRELFSNSESTMMETLDTIEAMSSISEALDYFYNDLNWDESNQDVIDFIEIVTHHFSGK